MYTKTQNNYIFIHMNACAVIGWGHTLLWILKEYAAETVVGQQLTNDRFTQMFPVTKALRRLRNSFIILCGTNQKGDFAGMPYTFSMPWASAVLQALYT